jgi:hypothetical protein
MATQIVEILLGIMWASVIPLLLWAFRDDINLQGRLNKYQHKDDPTIGTPDKIDKGIRYYKIRSHLPSFEEMTSMAKTAIKMSAITFTTLRYGHINGIKKLLQQGISITFLLLDPQSGHVDTKSELFSESTDLKHQIIDSLESLRQLQKDYPDKVIIKTYDEVAPRSIIIIDEEYIKVEDHPVGSDAESRPNHAAFRNSSPIFYNLYSLEYNQLEVKSEVYDYKTR